MDTAQAQDKAPESGEAAPKIKAMRRQPCPCGSGKVFKNCHEGDPRYEVATDAASAAAAPLPGDNRGPKAPAARAFGHQAQKYSSAARNTGNNHRRKV